MAQILAAGMGILALTLGCIKEAVAANVPIAESSGSTQETLMTELLSAIKIIDVPPGEAPLEVRQSWVGLTLPLKWPGRHLHRGVGVLTHPKTRLGWWWRKWFGPKTLTDSYAVDAHAALTILQASRPEAFDWWQKNTAYAFSQEALFVFAASACQEVPDVVWPPAPNAFAPS